MSNMSRAEAISILKKLKLDAEEYGKESDFVKQAVEVFEFAIASLEADEAYQLMEEQPEFCEDCISKSDALDSINWAYNLSDAYEKINMLPSVLPKADKPTIIDWNNCHTPEQLDSIATTKNDLGVDWDELKRKILMEVDGGTDDKWLRYADVCDRISNSIDEFVADMRGNAKRKGEPIEGNNESYNCENWIP